MTRHKPPGGPTADSPEDIEAQFYEALQKADLERLMAVWADEDEIVCVHPGGPRTVGLAAIRASFESIFANGAIPVVPELVQRLHSLSCAVHHLSERIGVQTDDGPRTARVVATNVYLKTPQGWRLVVHHASPGALEERGTGERPSTLH